MFKCWSEQPEKRPSFAELVKSFTNLLEEVAEYMDFSFVSGEELKNTSYDHLERYDQLEITDDGDRDHSVVEDVESLSKDDGNIITRNEDTQEQ